MTENKFDKKGVWVGCHHGGGEDGAGSSRSSLGQPLALLDPDLHRTLPQRIVMSTTPWRRKFSISVYLYLLFISHLLHVFLLYSTSVSSPPEPWLLLVSIVCPLFSIFWGYFQFSFFSV